MNRFKELCRLAEITGPRETKIAMEFWNDAIDTAAKHVDSEEGCVFDLYDFQVLDDGTSFGSKGN